MKIIVIYNGKTGFTKRYADWIAEEVACNILPYSDISKADIDSTDIVIFGSRVHAGRIENLQKVKKQFANHPKHRFIVFATGATPATVENAIKKIWDANFTESEINTIPHFYMQSGLDYEKMGFVDRTIMKVVGKLLNGKKDKSKDERGFEQAITNSHNISSKEYITPLLNFIKNIADVNQL